MKSEWIMYLVIFGFCILVAMVIIPLQEKSDQGDIKTWAAKNGHSIVKIERCHFLVGPYFFTKNCRVYRVNLLSGKTFWFRFRFLGTDIEEYDG